MASSASPQREILLEERLIEAVRRRRPLWDSSTPLHKNVRVLIHCWRDVSQELGISEATTKKKWKSLRDYFFRQVKDFEKYGSDSKDTELNTEYCMWPFYDLLTFLKANKKHADHTNYVLTDEDRELLDKISKHERRQRNNFNSITSKVSRPHSKKEETPVFATHISFGNYSDLDETTSQSKRGKKRPSVVITTEPKTLLQRSTKERMSKVTLCEPPPLRVFRNIPNILKKRDSLLTSIRAAQSQPQFNTLKPTPENDFKQSETNNTEFDADLHFFKSLLPFMWALPLKDKLRVRNGIQDLILKELSAIRTKDDLLDMGSQPTSSTYEDPLITPDDENNVPDQESQSNSSMIVKEEFEDADETVIFEVDSKSLTFESDDNNHYDDRQY